MSTPQPTLPPPVATRIEHANALALVAFGSIDVSGVAPSMAGRHLAFLPSDALDLDLDDPAQRRFGSYELVEKLGQGGMGVVYRARQTSLDRDVALKLLAAGPWAAPDFIARFQSEAQNAARLQHPNIVAIFEIGSQDGLHYFTMRLVHGPSLAQCLAKEGPFKPERAAEVVRRIAEALDYAHRLGILHLDLKPANVLTDERGEPLVADFGLARRLDQGGGADREEISGTPSYMAPEQAVINGPKLSQSTDIYGLGAILYELLAGRPPFVGANAQATLHRVLRDAPQPLRADHAHVPADLEAICLKCLEKDPAARYANARDLADDLGRFLDGRMVSVRPLNAPQRAARWARREPRFAAAVGAAVFALVAGLVASTSQWQRAEHSAAQSQALLWENRRDAALRLMQDGKGFDALPQLVDNVAEQEAAGALHDAAMDRQRIGTLLGQGLTLIDWTVVADANPLAVEISPDGARVALAFNDLTVRWYDTATLEEQGAIDLAGLPTASGRERVPVLLRFVGNDRLLATLEWYAHFVNPTFGDSHLIDLASGELVEPPLEFEDLADVTYGADGEYALLRNSRGDVQTWQVEPWRPVSAPLPTQEQRNEMLPWHLGRDAKFALRLGPGMSSMTWHDPRDLARAVPIPLPGGVNITAWAETHAGNAMALGDADGQMWLFDATARAMRQLPTYKGWSINWLAFSDDDHWLAAGGLDGVAYAFDVASGRALASGAMLHDFAVRRVAIDRHQRMLAVAGDGRTGLWRLPEPGPFAGAAARLVTSTTPHEVAAQYAIGSSLPTGLLATAGFDGELRLWRIPAAPNVPALADKGIGRPLRYDGRRVVDIDGTRVRLLQADGRGATPWHEAVGFAHLAAGSADGSRILLGAGRTLQLLATADAALSAPMAPIALDATAHRLALSADARIAATTLSHAGPHGFEERAETWDLATGRRLAGPVPLSGPLRRFLLSANGAYLLTVGPRRGATEVFDARTLASVGRYPHDPAAPVISADFSADGTALVMVERSDDPLSDRDRLVHCPLGGEPRFVPLHRVRPIGVVDAAGRVFVAGTVAHVFDPGGPAERRFEADSHATPTAVLAVSPDGRLIAQAFRSQVQLRDAKTGVALGPPLPANRSSESPPADLAFSPDSRQLLARSVTPRQSQWVWPIAPDLRPLDALSDDVTLLRSATRASNVRRQPTAARRVALRARDPGPIVAPDGAERLHTVSPAPRVPDTSPLLLDLTAVHNLHGEDELSTGANVVATGTGKLPYGVHRIDGVDFDIRGAVQLHFLGSTASNLAAPSRVTGIAVPDVPVAAFHVLLLAGHRETEPLERTYARLRLHYRDGSEAVAPIRTQRDVPGLTEDDRVVPFAWMFSDHNWALGDVDQMLVSNPRIANPHPERRIATLDLEAGDETWNAPVFFAITVAPAAAPVIAPR